MLMKFKSFVTLTFGIALGANSAALAAAPGPSAWGPRLEKLVRRIDEKAPGPLGLFVKRLGDDTELNYGGDRRFYLSSTVKVPVAVALLKRVEEGKLRLDQTLTLQKTDFVDGSGEVLWKEPGAVMNLSYLLDKMLTQSDSTATDMLIRLMGVDSMNEQVKSFAPGFGPITTLIDVRYGAYGELNPRARELSNMDFIEFKKAPAPERLRLFRERLQLTPEQIGAASVEEAFDRFYAKGFNSAPLRAVGAFLERLGEGELLNAEHTKLVLSTMARMTTGENRLKAGFPKGTVFAQKTGTQIGRMCNIGIVRPGKKNAVVVSACLEGFGDQAAAEKDLAKLGAAMSMARAL
ncbi:MAG: serine hydrolase [Proteobacteria bacterium]|nr:MAG: serine hydrolase [Pseudomonadota bacterium]